MARSNETIIMIILKAYQYFFYILYRFFEASTYSRWWSEWKANVVMLALSLWLYASIEITFHYLYEIPLKPSNFVIDISAGLFLLTVGILNWFLFEYDDRWKEIVKDFDSLSKRKNRIGSVIVWTVILGITIYYWFISLPLLEKIAYE